MKSICTVRGHCFLVQCGWPRFSMRYRENHKRKLAPPIDVFDPKIPLYISWYEGSTFLPKWLGMDEKRRDMLFISLSVTTTRSFVSIFSSPMGSIDWIYSIKDLPRRFCLHSHWLLHEERKDVVRFPKVAWELGCRNYKLTAFRLNVCKYMFCAMLDEEAPMNGMLYTSWNVLEDFRTDCILSMKLLRNMQIFWMELLCQLKVLPSGMNRSSFFCWMELTHSWLDSQMNARFLGFWSHIYSIRRQHSSSKLFVESVRSIGIWLSLAKKSKCLKGFMRVRAALAVISMQL